MKPLKLVVVSAGLSQPSSTRLLADRLAEADRRAPGRASAPVEVAVVELRDLAVDIANNLVTGFPGAALREALDAVTEADGLIAVTPDLHRLLQRAVQVVLRRDRQRPRSPASPCSIAATGGTARHSLALEHALRPLFAYLRAIVVPTAVYAASEDWGTAGDARTDGLAARIARAAGELAELIAAPARRRQAGRRRHPVRAAARGAAPLTPGERGTGGRDITPATGFSRPGVTPATAASSRPQAPHTAVPAPFTVASLRPRLIARRSAP